MSNDDYDDYDDDDTDDDYDDDDDDDDEDDEDDDDDDDANDGADEDDNDWLSIALPRRAFLLLRDARLYMVGSCRIPIWIHMVSVRIM